MIGASCTSNSPPGSGERALNQDNKVISSPNGKTKLEVSTDDAGRLKFTVSLNGQPIIEPSPVVFTIDGVDVTDAVQVGKADRYDVSEKYPWYGVHSTAVNRCNGARYAISHTKTNTQYTLDVRAYDDGVAFQIVAPGKPDQRRTPDERTAFTIPAGSALWFHGLRGHYEGDYKKHTIEDAKAGEWAAPPLTFKLANGGVPGGAGYGCITEANLVNYSGMALEADGNRAFTVGLGHRQPVSYPYELRYSKEDVERLSHPAVITGTITTPWRVVLVGQDLNALVNSDIVSNLCPPPDKTLFPLRDQDRLDPPRP